MASIFCLSTRLLTKNPISYSRQITIRNKNIVPTAFNIRLLDTNHATLRYTRNNNYNEVLKLLNVHSRSFKLSAIFREEIDVNVPEFPEAVAEGEIKWIKKVGDSVVVDEVVCNIETDKTVIEVNSPSNGVIVKSFIEEGGVVKSKQKVFRLKVGGVATKAAAKAQSVAQKTKGAAASIKPPPVPPIKQSAPKQDNKSVSKAPPKDPTKMITGSRTEYRVKMTKIRQRIGQRLKEAQNEAAMLTTFNEIDMTNLIAFRKLNQDAFTKKHGIKLGFMSTFIKACGYALQDQPIVNAYIENNEIIYRDFVDISVAVATPKGLVVPVIRNVPDMSFADIEKAISMLSEKARGGKLSVEDMKGGTFTVSNGGVFGSLMGTPIINPPQSAILGMHATFERPVAVKGQIVIKPMMYVALTYDHRLIDGREAVLFLRKIKSGVENPVIIIAGM